MVWAVKASFAKNFMGGGISRVYQNEGRGQGSNMVLVKTIFREHAPQEKMDFYASLEARPPLTISVGLCWAAQVGENCDRIIMTLRRFFVYGFVIEN